MRKRLLLLIMTMSIILVNAQINPAVKAWLQNTTIKGSHYIKNNSTAIPDTSTANVQLVKYSADWVYIYTNGVPSYTTGPFLDNNPSLASSQNAIFKVSLKPQKNTGAPTPTTGGNIGLFINGVALFDYRDGVSWNNAQSKLCGGPIMCPPPGGDGKWNRDAVVGERLGFDCSKGHPAMGNYHHHQNPSAFDMDLNVTSTVCSLYDADGLYKIDSTKHSPLIGFAYDGFPIYGAYAYKDTNGSGAIARMKSSYVLRNITVRTNWADGTDVLDGPPVDATYPLGYFREDYEYVPTTKTDYLDASNGRFCKTPEYPNGIYCYFATVDEKWNSAYPYVVGPNFYGVKTTTKPLSITEAVTVYADSVATKDTTKSSVLMNTNASFANVFASREGEFVVIQINDLVKQTIQVEMYSMDGKLVQKTAVLQGSTIAYMDTRTLYQGLYIVKITNGTEHEERKVFVEK